MTIIHVVDKDERNMEKMTPRIEEL